MRFLLVEDDRMIGESLQRALRLEGHAVDWVRDAAAADSTLASERFDLVLLDLGLPPGQGAGAGHADGLSVLRAARARHDPTPVIVLTARDARGDRVAGLDAGADDYLTKPFEFQELLARLRALLRRGEASEGRYLKCDDLQLDLYSRRANRGESDVELSNKEFALLEYFMRNPNRVLSRTQIAEHVWDMNFDPMSNVIDVYVAALRKKLDRNFPRELIHTVKNAGYRFGVME